MPTYVVLGKYTMEALKNFDEVPKRFQEHIDLIESKGGKLIATYGLMGEWDLLAITEFPDEKSAMSVLLKIGKEGRLVTRTMTAISSEDLIALSQEG